MKSFAFPDFLTSSNVKIIEDNEATESNLKLSLLSQQKQLFGDPAFGSKLIKLLYEQNDKIIVDIAVDYIYSNIQVFMPQLSVDRKDINILQDDEKIYASFTAINKLNNTVNLYNIDLITEGTEQ